MEEMEKAKAALAQEVSRYSMAGVISFLEQEWFTFQDEREKWELDRKDLARQIQTLTEKNKALENVQYDLVRRIKMLEYALVQERARYSGVQTSAPEPLKEEGQRKPLERPQRKSKGILERYLNDFDLRTAQLLSSVDLRPPVDKEEPASAILSSLLAVKKNVSSIDSNSVTPGTSSLSKSSGKGDAEEGLMGTVRKAMGDREDSQKMDKKKANLKEALAMLKGQNKTDGAKKGSFGNGVQSDGGSSGGGGSKKDAADEEEDFKAKIEKLRQSRREGKDQQQQQEKEKEQKKAKNEEEDGEESNNPTVKMHLSKFGKKSHMSSDKPVDSLGQLLGLEMELPLEISGDGSMGSMKRAAKSWQPQFILRHHLDVVRSVSFHEQEPILLSGSDDCTVKLWNWRSASTVGYKQPLSADIEPVYCFLGHTGAVYSVIMASQKKQCFSAGADTNIRIWQLPDSTQQDLYAERGKAITMDLGVLRGHTDAVWDLSYHPHRSLLVSSSSDATVKIWNVDNAVRGRGDPLMHTCLHPSNDPSNDDFIPTTVSFIPTDVNKLLVGYRTSELGVFDIETGKVVTLMAPTDTDASLSRLHTQMNKVVSHPHLELAISAHEDRTVKFWDLKSGTCVHSMIAHQTVVSSLAVDPAGGYVLTAGHGCSLRFWEISTKNCVQEIHAHRQKHDEGIYSVAYHPTLELVASGGADAMIRVYQ